MNDHERFVIDNISRVLVRCERRMIGLHSASINATRNADRISLANTVDSIRLDIDNAREILQELLEEAKKNDNAVDPRDRCNFD